MTRLFRTALAIFLPLILTYILIQLIEAIGYRIYPPPEGVNLKDLKALRSAMAQLPLGAALFVWAGWALGSFVGGWLAARVAERARTAHAMLVGLLLTAGGLANLILIPHPSWLWILGLATFLPLAYLGARLHGWPPEKLEPGTTGRP